MAPPADPALGVLFVHGFGGQKRSETLVRYGVPLVRWLTRWIDEETAHDPLARAIALNGTILTRVRQAETDEPAHTWISARRGVGGEPAPKGRWLIAESWWAGDFSPASFSEVATWGIGIGPWVYARYLQTRWRDWRLWVNLQVGVALVVGPLLQLLMLVLLVLAIVPFMRRFVGSVMLLLADSIGDAFVLVSSPMRFDAMVSQVESDLRWLVDEGCQTIAIVAHSQGTVVAHHAVRSLTEEAETASADPLNPVRKIKLFVTFGTAIDKLHRLQQVIPKNRRVVRGGLISSVGALLAVAGPYLVARLDWSPAWPWSLLLVAAGVAVFYFGVFYPGLNGEVAELTANDLWPEVTGQPSDVRWHDYVALADPVPDGRLPFPPPFDDPALCRDPRARVRTCEVRNRDSIIRDHSIYGENTEQFVSPLARALAELAGWDQSLDFAGRWGRVETGMRHRTLRVAWLTAAYVFAVGVAVGTITWLAVFDNLADAGQPIADGFSTLAEHLAIPFEGALKGGADEPGILRILGVALVTAIAAVWHRLAVFMGWRNWDRRMATELFVQPAVAGGTFDAFRGWKPFLMTTLATPLVVVGLVWLWFRYVV